MTRKLKPRYFVKLATIDGWQEPVAIDRDWTLKQWGDSEIRVSLVDDAAAHLNVSIDNVRTWVIRVEMVER